MDCFEFTINYFFNQDFLPLTHPWWLNHSRVSSRLVRLKRKKEDACVVGRGGSVVVAGFRSWISNFKFFLLFCGRRGGGLLLSSRSRTIHLRPMYLGMWDKGWIDLFKVVVDMMLSDAGRIMCGIDFDDSLPAHHPCTYICTYIHTVGINKLQLWWKGASITGFYVF